MAWPDYWTKLPSLLVGGNAPCLIGMQMGHVSEFKDSILRLNSKLASLGIKPGEFDPGIMRALQVDSKQLAVPYDLGPIIMCHNKDKFKAAGLSEPQNGWKIDEFVTDSKKLTSGANYGFAVDNSIEAIQQWGPTVVGKLADTAKGKLDVDNSEIASALKWYAGLVNKEKVAAPLIASAMSTAGTAFLGGTAAINTDGPWSMINVKHQAKFNVGVVSVPADPKGVTGPEALAYQGDQGRAYPARRAQQAPWYKNAVDGAQATLEAATKGGVPYRATATWTQDTLNWIQGVVTVINGAAPVRAFLKNTQSQSASQ